jgi:hypothetical protein
MNQDLGLKHDWAPDGEHIAVNTNTNLFNPFRPRGIDWGPRANWVKREGGCP